MISPVMPGTAERIAAQLGLAKDWMGAPFGELMDIYGLPGELETKLGEPLFPRIDDDARARIEEKVAARIAGGGTGAGGAEKPDKAGSEKSGKDEPGAGLITFEEFQRLELRVARIEAAEKIPKSKNLLKVEVSLGDERRTVVAGIAKHYTPEELAGRTVIMVANLKPVKLMGVESQGMLLAAEGADGLKLVGVEGEVPPGAKVR
jgi:methionyl-tRNA synthetase